VFFKLIFACKSIPILKKENGTILKPNLGINPTAIKSLLSNCVLKKRVGFQ